MNENNSMAYTQNNDSSNSNAQDTSVYGESAHNEPVHDESAQTIPVSLQKNNESVQDKPDYAQSEPVHTDTVYPSSDSTQGSTAYIQNDSAQTSAAFSQNAFAQNEPTQTSAAFSQNASVQDNTAFAQNNPAAAAYSNIPLLQLNDLCKRYPGMGNYMSVFHMNLIIPRGRIIGLLGPNGCGKTTLIKMINGLLAPTCGSVLINGLAPCPATKKVISYLPERTYLDNGMKVSQMVDYFADFYEDFSTDKAYGMLGALGISSDARLKTLSKGTKEKVQLILVMSRQADLYILDEPIAGVDPAARDYILRTIITNYNPGSTIILSTHLISDIENILDDVIFMKNGSLMLYTSVDSIRSQMGKSVDTYFREVYAC